MVNSLVNEIKSRIKGDVSDDPSVLLKASRDASIFEMKPEIVVFPKDVEDVKSLVKFVNEKKARGEKVSLTARSAGTDMTGGPLSESIVVDFTKYFNHIKEVGSDYAVAEPGAYYRDFEKETLKKDLLFPSYPASREICTMGGIVANNSGGEKTLSFGQTWNYVRSIKMVLRDGNEYEFKALTLQELEEKKKLKTLEGDVYRTMSNLVFEHYETIQQAKPTTSKNSSGYLLWNVFDKGKGIFDLTKVITGSQGTLGLITQVTLRLIRPQKHSRLVVVFLKNLDVLPELTKRILMWKPESFESYDDHTFLIALRLLPELIRKMKGGLISLGISFIPDLWAVLTGGMPKLFLFAEFTGDTPEEAQKKANEVGETLKEFHEKILITRSNEEGSKYFVIRRESFNLLRKHVKGKRTAPFIDDLVVHPNELPEFLPKLNALLKPYEKDITYTIAGHVGDANFHIIPLVDITKPHTREIIIALAHKVYDLVFAYKGSMSGEHNDGLIRGPYLRQMYGEEVFNLFKETKKIFDPDDIFNPGKKAEATFESAARHMVTN